LQIPQALEINRTGHDQQESCSPKRHRCLIEHLGKNNNARHSTQVLGDMRAG